MMDSVDMSPGFADLLHRHNLVGDYDSRTLTAEEAMKLAREAFEVGILEYRNDPEAIDRLHEEFVQELTGRH